MTRRSVLGAAVTAAVPARAMAALQAPAPAGDDIGFLSFGAHRANVDRINTVLGPNDAVPLDDFSRVVRVRTRAGALKMGRELETLLAGVYLNGAAYASDAGTRLLLVDLDAAGRRLDAYLKDPGS